jgi:hypothetical protein
MAVNKVIYGGNILVDLTGVTVTAADLADGVKATGADGNPIVGIMQKVPIDTELSATSTNPVQNKVIYNALQNKVGTDIFNGFSLRGGTTSILWQQSSRPAGYINAANYTGTAAKAEQDGAGNVITETYTKKADFDKIIGELGVAFDEKADKSDLASVATSGSYNDLINKPAYTVQSVNNVRPDENGNVTINIPTKVSALENDAGYLTMGTLPIFASTDSANTWKQRQTFNEAIFKEAVLVKARIVKEVYQSEYINGTAITPTRSTVRLIATGATTLDMTTIVAECLANNKTSTVFTAYITSDADYTLTITNAGTIKYIGSASDLAITSAGLLLNIWMSKDGGGNVTSIVQANKLEGGA